MKLNEIRDNEGSSKSRKRVGRGIGSGKGKTAGRGVKGQNARSGVAINGFEGGQMPLYRRLPKRGFSNAMFAARYNTVSLERVQTAIDAGKLDAKKPVNVETLLAAGIIRRAKDGVRLLSDGELKAKAKFEVNHASKAAIAKVEAAGGSIVKIGETPGVAPFIDDVILIDGIGTKSARALKALGVTKLSELVKMSDEALAKVSKGTGSGSQWKSKEWRVQAQEMIDGKPPRAAVDRELAHKMAGKAETRPAKTKPAKSS